MLNIRPSVGSLKSQIEALRTQILGLSDDPAALAELNARLNAMQMAADALPATQQAVAALQAALEQAVKKDQLNGVATQADIDTIMSLVSGIHMPDTSGLATKESVDQVRSEIPSIADLATHSDVSQVAARIPDVSGLATASSVSAVEAKIPDVSKLAQKTQVDTLSQTVAAIKVPDPAQVSPPATDLVQNLGQSTRYAREDHTHKARVKRAMVTIGVDGTAKWDFAEPFSAVPIITHMVQESTGTNRVNVIITSVTATSVTVYADRMRNLPTLQPMQGGLLATLTQVITGVNALVTALSGYNLSGGSATGVKVHLYAAEPTT